MKRLGEFASCVEPIGPHHSHLEGFEHRKGKPYLIPRLEGVERENLDSMGGKIPNLYTSPTHSPAQSRCCYNGRSLARSVWAIAADACLDAHQRSSA